MKIKINWQVKSEALALFIKNNSLNYGALCNAINNRIDKLEFSMDGDAKLGKAKMSKKDNSLNWTAKQGMVASEALESYDAPAMVHNLDRTLAKLEKDWGNTIVAQFTPDGGVTQWLLRFKKEQKPEQKA